jgi:hypothetical protein
LMSVLVAAAAEGEVPQAANSVSGSTASGAHEVVIEGEPGDIIVVGDLVFEIIDRKKWKSLHPSRFRMQAPHVGRMFPCPGLR